MPVTYNNLCPLQIRLIHVVQVVELSFMNLNEVEEHVGSIS